MSETPVQTWFRAYLGLRDHLAAAQLGENLAYDDSGWQRAVGDFLLHHFGCHASNITYFKPVEKQDQLIAPTWYWRGGGAKVKAMPSEAWRRLRAVFKSGAGDEVGALGASRNAGGLRPPTAFERTLRCRLAPDGEVSAMSILYLARERHRADLSVDSETLVCWLQGLGLVGAGGATERGQRLLNWLTRYGRKWILGGDEGVADLEAALNGSPERVVGRLRATGLRNLTFGMNILGHLVLRLVVRPVRGDAMGFDAAVHEYFETVPSNEMLDKPSTDRSIIILPLVSGSSEDRYRLNAYFLGSHIGLSDQITALAKGAAAASGLDWELYGQLAASIEAVATPLLLRAVLRHELPRASYDTGLQVLGHHVGKLFQESGIVSLLADKPAEPSEHHAQGVAKRLLVAWGIAEATRAMKSKGDGLPRTWFTKTAEPLDPPGLVPAVAGLCRFYLSGFLGALPADWEVDLNGDLLAFAVLDGVFFNMPALAPFLDDMKKAGTSAVTLGLAELIRNIRHHLKSAEVDYKLALRRGTLKQPVLRLSVKADQFKVGVKFRYPILESASSHSPSLERIQDFEAQLLSVRGLPIAKTSQVSLRGQARQGWDTGTATWRYYPSNVHFAPGS